MFLFQKLEMLLDLDFFWHTLYMSSLHQSFNDACCLWPWLGPGHHRTADWVWYIQVPLWCCCKFCLQCFDGYKKLHLAKIYGLFDWYWGGGHMSVSGFAGGCALSQSFCSWTSKICSQRRSEVASQRSRTISRHMPCTQQIVSILTCILLYVFALQLLHHSVYARSTVYIARWIILAYPDNN